MFARAMSSTPGMFPVPSRFRAPSGRPESASCRPARRSSFIAAGDSARWLETRRSCSTDVASMLRRWMSACSSGAPPAKSRSMQPRSRTLDRVRTMDDAMVASTFGPESARQQLYRRTLVVIVISQVFGGAGLAAGVAVGALLAQQMLGNDSFTGAPVALFTLGSAGSALVVGRLSHRFGRRLGLFVGYVAGGAGAAGVVLAAVTDSIPLLFASLLVYGAGTATNLQARYA